MLMRLAPHPPAVDQGPLLLNPPKPQLEGETVGSTPDGRLVDTSKTGAVFR